MAAMKRCNLVNCATVVAILLLLPSTLIAAETSENVFITRDDESTPAPLANETEMTSSNGELVTGATYDVYVNSTDIETMSSVTSSSIPAVNGAGSQSESPVEEGRDVIQEFYMRYNTTTEVDLVFVLDRSGSVPRKGWHSIIEFVKNVLEHFTVDQHNTRVAVVTFSTTSAIDLNDLEPGAEADVETKCTLYRRLDQRVARRTPYGYTATHDALQNAAQVLVESRATSKKAVIVVTDGKSNIGPPPVRMAVDILGLRWSPDAWDSDLYGPQVEIYAFGVADANSAELASIASKLPGHVFTMSTFSMFEDFARSLHGDKQERNWVLASPDDCGDSCIGPHTHCMCGTKSGHFACVCDPGYHLVDDHCSPCKKGYYKEVLTPEQCRQCPQNTTTSREGSTRKADCKPLPGHVRCPPLPAVEHAVLFYVEGDVADEVSDTGLPCTGVTDGNSCHYACKTGYRLTAPPALTCNYSGVWVGTVPACRVIDCHPIDTRYQALVGLTVQYLNASTMFGSLVLVDCRRGSIAIGEMQWTCDENGLWTTPADFQCRDIHCSEVPTDNYLDASPNECRADKVPLDTECHLQCSMYGYQLVGATDYVCRFDGSVSSWNPDQWPECKDILPPEMTCPKDLDVTVADWGHNTTIVHYDVQKPQITDNSGTCKYRVLGVPNDQLLFPVGFVALTYEAYDEAGNTASCIQYVHVRARTVEVNNCPDDITVTVTSLRRTARVDWSPPVFLGAAGAVLPHVCSVASGSEFVFGTHQVACYAREYPGITCHFQVKIEDPPCPIPNADRPPANGVLVCGMTGHYYPRACRIHCREGHDLRRYEATHKFVCHWDGTWSIDGAWPDCYMTRRASKALIENQLYIRYSGACVDSRTDIAEAFVATMSRLLQDEHGPCPADQQCSIDQLHVICGAASGGPRSSRRRRRHSPSKGESDVIVEFVISASVADTRRPVSAADQKQLMATLDEVSDTLLNSAVLQDQSVLPGLEVTDAREVGRRWDRVECRHGEIRDELLTNTRSSVCYACPPGTFKSEEQCIPCPADTYQPVDGAVSCLPCPAGTHTITAGSQHVTDCREHCSPGHYSTTGLEPCTPCASGSFQNVSGSTECKSCPETAPYTSPVVAATDVNSCMQFVECDLYNVQCDTDSGFRCVLRAFYFDQPYYDYIAAECICVEGLDKCQKAAVNKSQTTRIDSNIPATPEEPQQTRWMLPNGQQTAHKTDFDLVFGWPVDQQRRMEWIHSVKQSSLSVCMWLRLARIQTETAVVLSFVSQTQRLPQQHLIAVSTVTSRLTVNDTAANIHVNQDAWNHICMSWTQLTGYSIFYVNGTSVLDVYWPSVGNYIQQGDALRIGDSFAGQLSELAVFNHVISVHDVATLARRSAARCQHSAGNLLSWSDIHTRVTSDGNVTSPDVAVVAGSRCLDDTEDVMDTLTRNCFDSSELQCQNGGTCRLTFNGQLFCRCKPNYTGKMCQTPLPGETRDTATGLNQCSPGSCLNGGTCSINSDGVATCICTGKWTGKRCQVRHNQASCALNPCVNNGTCVDVDNSLQPSYRCLCADVTTADGRFVLLGANCEHLSACDALPCGDHGTCVAMDTDNSAGQAVHSAGYRCICEDGFEGTDCLMRHRTEKPAADSLHSMIDYCSQVDCLNGATCVNTVHGFSCRCSRDFTGRYCSTPRNTDVKRFHVAVTLLMNHSLDILYNSVFHDGFRLQIHRVFANLTGDNKLYVVINDVRSHSNMVTVDFSLIFTRYLDAMLFAADDVTGLLQRHLATGRLGQFVATLDNFVCEELHVEVTTGMSGVDRDIVLLVIFCSVALVLSSALCARCLTKNSYLPRCRLWDSSASTSSVNGEMRYVNNIGRNTVNNDYVTATKDNLLKLLNKTEEVEQNKMPIKDEIVGNYEAKYQLNSTRNLWRVENQLDEAGQ